MNKLESRMAGILVNLRDSYGAVSVKAEFEAEGTRLEELLRLVDIGKSVGLPLTVKIGGCEAIRDLLEAKQIGCRYIVAPMVETPYAASKFRDAKDFVYTDYEQRGTDFLFNLETETGFANREQLFEVTKLGTGLSGVVFGRHDFVLSMGWDASTISSEETNNYAMELARLCREYDKELVVGGGMSIESIENLNKLQKIRLDRFETRKIVFDAASGLQSDISKGLMHAVEFEYLWLVNKRDYYYRISNEDQRRILHFESRLGINRDKSVFQ